MTRPKKFIPDSSLNDDDWHYQYYKYNALPIRSYFPEGTKGWNPLTLIREAAKRKGHLTDEDVLNLVGKPNRVKPAVFGFW